MLMEMQLAYAFEPVRPRIESAAPEFRSINPRGKVPVLRHKDLILTESAAIVHYLADAFPVPAGMQPLRGPVARARRDEWSYFIMTELDAHALYVIRRHTDLKHLFGDAPVAVDAARVYFQTQIEAMRSRIGGQSAYLMGAGFSAVDILMATTLDWANNAGISLPDEVRAYHERTLARPAYQAARARTFELAC
jgi:glutathione S-transferase